MRASWAQTSTIVVSIRAVTTWTWILRYSHISNFHRGRYRYYTANSEANGSATMTTRSTPSYAQHSRMPSDEKPREIIISSAPICFHGLRYSRLPQSLLLFETYAKCVLTNYNLLCPFLAWRPEFHSNHYVNSSALYIASPLHLDGSLFAFILCFFTEFAFNAATPTARTSRPPRKPLSTKAVRAVAGW